MEKQIINVKITTEGEKCEMTTEEIKTWYEEKIAGLFNAEYGTPKIEIDVQRITE
jgi:hypothetical protein